MSSTYHVIYPRGERDKLSIVEIVPALDYELADYAVASRESFDSYQAAATYTKELAQKHGKQFIPDRGEDDFLD